MLITYDEPKRQSNIAKHGLDFASLTLEFFEAAMILPAKDDRALAIGELDGQIVVAVVFRALGVEALSIISMRPASRKERTLI
ncbi:MAG TPA: BrnT family toxin [Devosia sp.]|uniref:BrnT family toxin n=1 Tax=Devosia sp. TaxID=1871048 RepID=UPI002DDCF9F6|nr:BrnT family toxin [Devosia sp.]HEV2514164.1 BrnT family toxin [Devosia sp.]